MKERLKDLLKNLKYLAEENLYELVLVTILVIMSLTMITLVLRDANHKKEIAVFCAENGYSGYKTLGHEENFCTKLEDGTDIIISVEELR